MNFREFYQRSINESKVTDISGMLKGLASFKQDISKWDLSKVKNHEDAFTGSGIESKAKKMVS